jgi:hypothetical protein
MFIDPFALQSSVGLAAPALSRLTPLIGPQTQAWGLGVPLTFAYTSGSGNVGFVGGTRGQQTTTREMTEAWDGDAMAQIATAAVNGTGHFRCEQAWKTAGHVGAGNFTCDAPISPSAFRFLIGWLFDLDQVNGGLGGSNAVAINVTQAYVEAAITVQQVGSLLVAAGWCMNYLTTPFTFTAGWTKLDERITDTDPARPCGAIASLISTATGSTTVRMSSNAAVTDTDWAMVVAEFLPG